MEWFVSALELIGHNNQMAEHERFFEWARSETPHVEDSHYELGGSAAEGLVYGPIVATNMEYMRTHDVPAETAVQAIALLSTAAVRAEAIFKPVSDLPEDFVYALGRTQAAMSHGEFRLLPETHAMAVEPSRRLANTADKLLGDSPPWLQIILAEANYSSYFRRPTMSDGKKLLAMNTSDVLESKYGDGMSHLDRSNYAIGQLAAAFAANVRRGTGGLVLWDQGSGSGATMARIVKELSDGDHPVVEVTGNEPNPDFYKHTYKLTGSFRSLLRDVAMHGVHLYPADVLSVSKNINVHIGRGNPRDVLAVDANYVWHRLPTQAKSEMIDRIDQASANTIFYGGDLSDNTSVINRRYFNYSNNGLLNPGNIGLRAMFEQKGYRTIAIADEGADFKSIHPKLVEKLKQDAANDGHFLVAYKGPEAERLVLAA